MSDGVFADAGGATGTEVDPMPVLTPMPMLPDKAMTTRQHTEDDDD